MNPSSLERKLGIYFLVLFALCLVAVESNAQTTPVRVLIVDETKTFTESLQVNALVGVLKQNPTLEIDARLVDVKSSLDLPFQSGELESRYDLIVIIPLDVGRLQRVWLFGRPFYRSKEASVEAGAVFVSGVVEKIFSLQNVKIVGIEEDLVPAIFAGVFLNNGWL